MMSSKFFNWGDFFWFSCLVILVKYWFIVLASRDSSEMRFSSFHLRLTWVPCSLSWLKIRFSTVSIFASDRDFHGLPLLCFLFEMGIFGYISVVYFFGTYKINLHLIIFFYNHVNFCFITIVKRNIMDLERSCDLQSRIKITLDLQWYLRRCTPVNRAILRWNLCLNEMLETATHQGKRLLNKRSELVSKCRHFNKLLLMNCEDNITWWQATDVLFCCPEVP